MGTLSVLGWFAMLAPLAAGLVLVHLAERGRRIDDHPLCRRCGFDLFGLPPTSTNCSECGADLARRRAVRIGHRRRRGGMLAAGLLLILPGLGGITFIGTTVWWGSADINNFKPVWFLAREMGSGNALTRDVAMREIGNRVAAATLTPAQASVVVERILAWQADEKRGWVSAWGQMLQSMRRGGLVTDAQWERFAANAFFIAADVRPTLRRGDSLPFAISVVQGRGADAVALQPVWYLAGHAVGDRWLPRDPIGSDVLPGQPLRRQSNFVRIAPEYLRGVPDGPTTVRFDVTLELHDPRSRTPAPIVKRPIKVTAPLEILPADGTGVRLEMSPAVRDAVKSAVGVVRHRSLRVQGPRDVEIDPNGLVGVTIRAHAPPIDVSYEVLLRTEHGEWPLGTVLFRAKEWGVRNLFAQVAALRGVEVKSAAISLRPDSSAARATIDVLAICGSELAFRDLLVHQVNQPVRRPAPATTRARRDVGRSAAPVR